MIHASRESALAAMAIGFVILVRVLHADQPILENYVGRQVPTAMVARNLELGSGFLRPQLDTAPFPNLFLVEPPIYEQVVVALRGAIPRPREWIGRFVSAVATGLAAWGLFGLARRREGFVVALLAVLAFGLFPVTIRYGRAFQPDALMLGLMVSGLRAWDEHEVQGGQGRLVAAWLLIAAGLAVKVVAAFLLVPLVVAILRPPRARKTALVALTLVPALLWYIHATRVLGEGSRASADNAAVWSRAMGFLPLLKPETWITSARYLFVRSFTPVGFLMAACGLLAVQGGDRLWRIWLGATAAAFVVMSGKIHHEYYWMTLAPVMAFGVARTARGQATPPPTASVPPNARVKIRWGGIAFVVFAGLSVYQSASTWRTPPEWRALPAAVEAWRRIPDPYRRGPMLVAPEALLWAAETRGFRLEVEPSARLRAAGEFGARIDPDDPLALLRFYADRGARYVCDLHPIGDEPHRRLLHDAIRRRYKVVVDRDGVILAELVEKEPAP